MRWRSSIEDDRRPSKITVALLAKTKAQRRQENLTIIGSIRQRLFIQREKCKALILSTTYETRRQVLWSFREMAKDSMTQDPMMWGWAKKLTARAFDIIWREIEDEVERDLEAALLLELESADENGPSGSGAASWFWRFRAFLLHHYFPHDVSFFGKTRDPIYLVITVLTLMPVCGLRFLIFGLILLLLKIPAPADEFMMLNFIMIFKGFQFLSAGIMKPMLAGLTFYLCYGSKTGDTECVNESGIMTHGFVSQAADYFGNVILIWIAWYSLRYTVKSAEHRMGGDFDEEDIGFRSKTQESLVGLQAGGSFGFFLRYDAICFCLSLLLLAVLSYLRCEPAPIWVFLQSHMFRMNIFWCNAIYAFTTAPFVPLNVPWLFYICTKSLPTGFNENGACVAYQIALTSLKPEAEDGIWDKMSRIRELGRQKRKGLGYSSEQPSERSLLSPRTPGTDAEDEAYGSMEATYDFFYGLWRATLYGEIDDTTCVETLPDLVPNDHQMSSWDHY